MVQAAYLRARGASHTEHRQFANKTAMKAAAQVFNNQHTCAVKLATGSQHHSYRASTAYLFLGLYLQSGYSKVCLV